jgi:hypothetical protein
MSHITHVAANRLYSFIERNVYLSARSAGATPRVAYRMGVGALRRREGSGKVAARLFCVTRRCRTSTTPIAGTTFRR